MGNSRFIIQEKYKISGEKPGSGNTENLGSIKTAKFENFVHGKGPFSVLGREVYEHYWSNYPGYRDMNKKSSYTNLKSYFDWLKTQETSFDISKLKKKYSEWKKSFHD